jgi:nitroimidazol reductase NimA-like FMN-containing flavoprotein (pyridoxamine 5'-phosphate oxidase superfamily)
MNIYEMSRDESLEVLAEARLARLACVKDGQPYIVPVYIACSRTPEGEPCLYGFTTQGQKVEWMRANPRVCVEVDDVAASDRWVSVVVFGRFEELPDGHAHDGPWLRAPVGTQPDRDVSVERAEEIEERRHAYDVLRAQAAWWQPGSSAHVPPAPGRLAPIFYRVSIDRVSGHRATPDPRPVAPPDPAAPGEGWLPRLLHFLGRTRSA